jgi:F0F1-type ATP synthase membrane subunit c/vacuolar-type H+-ATPase subunit K
VDLDSAAPASSRRGLIGALGAAGLASAAALSIARPASAAPSGTTPNDKVLLGDAMRAELTAQSLYLEAINAGLSDVAAGLAGVFAENHVTYADKIAGAAGLSANVRNEALFEQLQPTFATSDADAFAAAAAELENSLAATHTALLPQYVSVSARTLTASIVVVEARMATVLTDFGGLVSNLDDVFDPAAQVLDLTAGAES